MNKSAEFEKELNFKADRYMFSLSKCILLAFFNRAFKSKILK